MPSLTVNMIFSNLILQMYSPQHCEAWMVNMLGRSPPRPWDEPARVLRRMDNSHTWLENMLSTSTGRWMHYTRTLST